MKSARAKERNLINEIITKLIKIDYTSKYESETNCNSIAKMGNSIRFKLLPHKFVRISLNFD